MTFLMGEGTSGADSPGYIPVLQAGWVRSGSPQGSRARLGHVLLLPAWQSLLIFRTSHEHLRMRLLYSSLADAEVESKRAVLLVLTF